MIIEAGHCRPIMVLLWFYFSGLSNRVIRINILITGDCSQSVSIPIFALTLSMLGKNFSLKHFEIFFPENGFWQVIHEMSKTISWKKTELVPGGPQIPWPVLFLNYRNNLSSWQWYMAKSMDHEI